MLYLLKLALTGQLQLVYIECVPPLSSQSLFVTLYQVLNTHFKTVLKGIFSFPFPSSMFYLRLCFRCRLNSTRLCCEAMVYSVCSDHCLSRKPGDKRVMHGACCEMPAVRTAVTLSKGKHFYCNNDNASVRFKEKRQWKRQAIETLWPNTEYLLSEQVHCLYSLLSVWRSGNNVCLGVCLHRYAYMYAYVF